MPYNENDIRRAAQKIILPLTDIITWQWEEKKQVLLAEFASGKAQKVNEVLRQHITHEWNKDTIKSVPNSIKVELGDNAKLTKTQTLFTSSPENNQPTVVAILWPWGHGSTLSLRLTLLNTPYEYVEPIYSDNILIRAFQKIKSLIA